MYWNEFLFSFTPMLDFFCPTPEEKTFDLKFLFNSFLQIITTLLGVAGAVYVATLMYKKEKSDKHKTRLVRVTMKLKRLDARIDDIYVHINKFLSIDRTQTLHDKKDKIKSHPKESEKAVNGVNLNTIEFDEFINDLPNMSSSEAEAVEQIINKLYEIRNNMSQASEMLIKIIELDETLNNLSDFLDNKSPT